MKRFPFFHWDKLKTLVQVPLLPFKKIDFMTDI